MFQIDTNDAASTLPTPKTSGTPGYFDSGDPLSGREATVLDEDYLNMQMLECINVVKEAGLSPDKTSYNQMSSAVRKSGALHLWSSDLASDIGGYPQWARVTDANGLIWISTAAANLTQPGTSGASWISLLDYLGVTSGTQPDLRDSTNIIFSRNGTMVRMSWQEANVYDGKNIILPFTFKTAYVFGDCTVAPANHSAWLGGTVGSNVLTVKAGAQNGGDGSIVQSGDGYSGSFLVDGMLAS